MHASEGDPVLGLSRVLVAEGGRLETPDHVAILYVLARRHRLQGLRAYSYLGVAERYSVAFNGRSQDPERAERMRTLPRSAIPRHITSLVEAWLRGVRPVDPCPGAIHWAAPRIRSPLRRATCSNPTVNAFYLGAE